MVNITFSESNTALQIGSNMLDNREEILLKHIRGKRVLDIGCIDYNTRAELNPSWVHRFISNNANYVLGVDLEVVHK